jgi:hypothetical protein
LALNSSQCCAIALLGALRVPGSNRAIRALRPGAQHGGVAPQEIEYKSPGIQLILKRRGPLEVLRSNNATDLEDRFRIGPHLIERGAQLFGRRKIRQQYTKERLTL